MNLVIIDGQVCVASDTDVERIRRHKRLRKSLDVSLSPLPEAHMIKPPRSGGYGPSNAGVRV